MTGKKSVKTSYIKSTKINRVYSTFKWKNNENIIQRKLHTIIKIFNSHVNKIIKITLNKVNLPRRQDFTLIYPILPKFIKNYYLLIRILSNSHPCNLKFKKTITHFCV